MRKIGLRLRRARVVAIRWFAPGEISERWNYLNLYREVAWYGILSGVNATFTSIFALRLGASNFLIALLTSLPALMNVLFQIPAARLVERESDKKRTLLVSGLLMRLPAFLIALVPLLGKGIQASAIVYITALGTIPTAVSTVSFTAMLAEVVAPQDRARVVSIRNVALSAMSTAAVLLTGKALDVLPFPFGYQLIFTLAFLASVLSLYYLGRVVIPGTERMQQVEVQSSQRLGTRHLLQAILAHRDYVRFTLGAFLYHWGLYFPIPLYAIYRVRMLQISDGWIGILAMVESGVTIVAYYAWGRFAQRRGSRLLLLLGLLGVCFYPIGTALSKSVMPLLLVSFIAGLASPAFNLGLFNGLLEVVPSERRATYIAIFNTMMNIPAFAAPILGTTVAGWVGVRTALWIGGAARIAVFLAFAYLILAPPRLLVRRFQQTLTDVK
nr:MFS transporter [Chloroflexota bacterium]